jgi:hypothetical protein
VKVYGSGAEGCERNDLIAPNATNTNIKLDISMLCGNGSDEPLISDLEQRQGSS